VTVRTLVPGWARRAPSAARRGALGVLGALAVAAVLAGPSTAEATPSETENSLVTSEPANGSTLGSSPTVLTFVFANELGDDDQFTAPVACGNAPQDTGIPVVEDDGLTVTVEVLSPLPRGACVIGWLLRDGLQATIAEGIITFSVEASPDTTTATTSGPTTATTEPPAANDDAPTDEGSAGGALWLGRVLSTMGILIVFGSLVLIGTAWPEGTEYVVTVRFLRSMWALALIGTVLFVIALTADLTDRSFGASLSPGTWFDLLDEGGPGRAALARLLLVLLTAWVVIRPERVIDPTTQLVAYGIAGLAVVTVGFSRTGGDLEVVGIAMAIAHAFAAAVWFGGAVLVARVVLAGPGDDDLVQAVRGFSRISVPAILATVATGVVQVIRLVGGSLFTSDHGRVMLLKAVAVAAMVFVAMTTRQVVASRLDRAHEMTVPLADRFRRAFGAEAAIGVVVLALSGWLLALTPAQLSDDGDVDYAVTESFVDPASGLDVDVSIDPAEVGLNGILVDVNAPAEGLSDLVVSFLPPEGAVARGIDQPIPLTGAGAVVLPQDVGIPFDVAGTWTLQVSGVTSTGAVSGAQQTFQVTGGDDSTSTTTSTTTGGVVTVIVDPALTTTTTAG
jgi:copper transport protein